MNSNVWMSRASKLASSHAALDDPSAEVVRSALCQLHALVLEGPHAVSSAYTGLSEADLTAAGEASVDRLTAGDFGWAPLAESSVAGWVQSVASQIRGLDHALATTYTVHHGPMTSPDVWLCRDAGAWVVPRRRPRHLRRRDGQGYSRRGLVHHRILPTEVMGYPLRLVIQDTLSGPGGFTEGVRMGAALFQGLDLTTQQVKGGFVVTDVNCADQENVVRHQIASAYEDGCFGAIWPELTLTPALRDHIEHILRDRALDDDPRMTLQVVVAGSWHEERDGTLANVTVVLDGYGRPTLEYRKLVPYVSKELGVEAITPGIEIPILVTEERLLAFGICRDFCDVGLDSPYPQLDVDLVLVPSMGGDETMRGHCLTAKTMRVRYDALTFVVQQREPAGEPGDFIGMVLPMPDNPARIVLKGLRQTSEWASHPETVDQDKRET